MSDENGCNQRSTAIETERLELALRASNEGIWDWQIDEGTIYYSRRILEFLECGEGNAPNLFLPPFGSIHEEDRSYFETRVGHALEIGAGETLSTDVRVITGSGGWRWLRIRGSIIRDRSGAAMRIAGSMIDISHRKKTEEMLDEERFLLRQVIDHIPLQVYFKDVNSRFVMANAGMADWMNLPSPADLIGRSDSDFFSEAHSGPARADEQKIMESGVAMMNKLECETWSGDEDETWVTTSKFPWRDRNGITKGTFGVSSDVTKLVKATQRATELAEELKRRTDMYEEELQLAREIQQGLASSGFPEIEDPAGEPLKFAARYIPISGMAGDFFEVMPIDDHTVGLLICDVMGHGVRSALVVAMLRGLLEKQRMQAADPGCFLAGLNDGLAAILDRAGSTMFATAFYAVADLERGVLAYACAGHPGAIVIGSGGVQQIAAERVEKGPGLGLVLGARFPNLELPLEHVKLLLMYTDGVLEARNKTGDQFYEERLMRLASESAARGLDGMLDHLIDGVLKFCEGQRFDDDVCLLVAGFPRKNAGVLVTR